MAAAGTLRTASCPWPPHYHPPRLFPLVLRHHEDVVDYQPVQPVALRQVERVCPPPRYRLLPPLLRLPFSSRCYHLRPLSTCLCLPSLVSSLPCPYCGLVFPLLLLWSPPLLLHRLRTLRRRG